VPDRRADLTPVLGRLHKFKINVIYRPDFACLCLYPRLYARRLYASTSLKNTTIFMIHVPTFYMPVLYDK